MGEVYGDTVISKGRNKPSQNRSSSYNCAVCGEVVEPVSLSGGGLIGWYCFECEKFFPIESLDTGMSKSMEEMER